MNEFMALITQVFLISCIQTIFEVFIDKENMPYMHRIISITCFSGSLYLVLEFIFNTLIKELLTMMSVLH